MEENRRMEREVLVEDGEIYSYIKAYVQAIPTFTMSCFDLTKLLCEEMSTMICIFWWAQQDKDNKMH
jgi:hypothetical protein